MQTIDFSQLDDAHLRHYADNARTMLPTYDALFAMMDAYLTPAVPDAAELLIVGAGGGEELVSFGLRHPRWNFVGVDPSAGMMALAERRVAAEAKAQLADRTTLFVGSLAALPMQPRPFDAATCVLTLHFLADDGKLDLLCEVAARLAPNAPLVLVSGFGDPASTEFRLHVDALQRQALRSSGHQKLAAQLRRNAESFRAVTEDQLCALLCDAGFTAPCRFFQTWNIGGWIARRTPARD